ncbi:LysR family transcriptional regulator [uncultured Tateyamaria sp.]|uniref:LysR family transcriptional regulator n=1 Tax=uncultured Tateyamaria sp. TaxID=455651 RepID=UPI002625BFAF|nr:LysR family transcriptional regulator [uncultured Tateyamaria sp.]
MVQKHTNTSGWDGLQAILLVARHGTVRAAATEIGVAHTTLAHRIAVAEKAMGVTAFVKSVRGYALTDEGAQIVEHAERMAAESEALARSLDGAGKVARGPVTVSMNASLLTHVAAASVATLRARHPNIALTFLLGDAFADLDRRDSDIVLRMQNAPAPSLFGRRLCQVRSTVFVARDAKGSLEQAKSPLPVIGWARDAVVETTFASLGFDNVRVVATVSDIDAQAAIAQTTPVAVELPCYLGDALPQLVRLAPTRLRDLNALWILTHDSLRNSPRIRAAFEALSSAVLDRREMIEGIALPTREEA